MAATVQHTWPFVESSDVDDGSVLINAHCRLRTRDGHRVVSVRGIAIAHYAVDDSMAEAHAMVSLIDQGCAKQVEVAAAFGCSERTVRRHQRRFEDGGLAALGRPRGYPRGRPRLPETRTKLIDRLKAKGKSNREIASQLGVSDKAIRKVLRRLGWRSQQAEQLQLVAEGADPKLSGDASPESDVRAEVTELQRKSCVSSAPKGADPKLSGSDSSADDLDETVRSVSFDADPGNREVDRFLAALGLLEDAAPLFRSATNVPNAGVLLAVPALVDSGVIDVARDVYGSIGPAFYGLRTTVVTLLLMALMRIKRPESLKEHNPEELGRLLGLDRAPEVKTVRRKLTRLAAYGRASEFGRALAERRVQSRGHAMGFLYVDGHVRAYHGKRDLPKAYVARRHLAMPATTDYWVNDAQGEPLFMITSEANKQLMTMLPEVLAEVRSLIGDRRVTVVFDRGGWSQKLFKKLIADGFDILTYRKGKFRRVAKKHFSVHEETVNGKRLRYTLADREVRFLKQTLRLRQVTRLAEDGHQVGIVTSRRDLSALEVVYRLTERWRQENFFKYLREEYALDALVDYSTEPADEQRSVPNPERRKMNAEIRKARAELSQLAAEYGVEALVNRESARRTMRGFKIANAPLSRAIVNQMERIMSLEQRRTKTPTRVPVQQVARGEIVKLGTERKHLTDLLKMVAYQAECDLLRLIEPHYRRAEDEGRALVRSALTGAGDIHVSDGALSLSLHPLSSPHRTKALRALCEKLNAMPSRFPGSKLTLQFRVKPEPPVSLAFPGARPAASAE
jgi:transposase